MGVIAPMSWGCVKSPIYNVCVLAGLTRHLILIIVNQFSVRLRVKPAMTR